MLIIKAVGDVM